MNEVNIGIEVKILINKVSSKFFNKHPQIYQQFLTGIKNYYANKQTNIDIVALKNHQGIYRMRLKDYRVIYRLINGEIMIIEVLMAKSRGDVYKHFK